MEILKRHRNLLRKRLTRSLKTTEEFLSGTPPIPVEDIEYNREIIEETHGELLVIQSKIRDFMLTSDVSEEELEQDDEEALQYTQRYKRIYKKCLALVEPRRTASSPTTSEVSFASSSHHRTVKLPKIELKKFTGEIKDWLGWWAQFNKIHVDPALEDSDKFQYLVQSMSPGTRASKLVDSYPLTAENYPKVIETLTERFGRPELLQQVYVRDLIRLMIDCSSKQQLKVTSFYDELVTHLRALESLKIEARQMSVFIFPMIEACLSEELMKAWQRSPLHDVKIDANDSTQTRVDLIMEFLQKEAAAEQDRALAGSKFGLRSLKQDRNVGRQSHPAKIPTASGLFAGRAQNCIFCNKDHKNTECLAARRMSIKERRERIKNAKCCFSCLQPGHISSNCRRRITECIRCKKKHLDILCPLNAPGRESADEDKEQVKDCDVSPTVENGVSFSGLSASSLILLQTLKIKVEGATLAKVVRALLDTGSQRSYILSKTAQDLGLSPIGQESLKHVVFGGHTSESVHQEYRVNLGHASGNFKMVAKLLDQQKICGNLPRLSLGPWLKELKARKIWVPDIGKDDMEIEILLGCDVLGSIFMMKSCVLSNGLTASQTRFGWTLMGECQPGSDVSLAHHVTTMTISESSITNLWNLDVLGNMDPIEVKQRDQRDALARRHFLKTVQHSVSGRYVVSLPWTVEKAKIADNREVAMKRLEQTTKKLISLNLYEDYDDIFRGWLDDGIIEKVPAEQHDAEAFYLPHRPVVKLSSGTTPIRPVFDASSKMIPNLMLRFRNGKFGVVADIKKAFLQIEVNERDRDYLRFLWYSQNGEKTEVFRHRRVVFGVNCSPFILGAVIEYHLSNVRPEHKPLAQRLQKSFYVDNLVTSVNSFEELKDLKLTATSIMENSRMELSQWEHSLDVASDTYPFERAEISKVLGVCWDKREDCLSCEIPVAIPPKITKRNILSCLAQIYDPIGFLNPILIKPKILLQRVWIKRDNQLGTFVGNRVKEICRLSDPGDWRYVPSECNPTDLPSRGCSLSRLMQSRWWERLIRSLKDILKRMLGTSTLTYQQLMTLLCHAEAVMNGRPMTYVSDDPNDLVTISPSMFLQEQTDVEFPECQNMGSNPTTQKLRYLSKLREELKSRFRKEYLSLLVQRNRRIYNPKLQAGDVVLVGMDNKKRNFWPLAVIEEILFGRDGVNRLVKVKTAVGTFLRPIQKIYPLEISSTAASSRLLNDRKEKTAKIQTRSGRTICKPNRLDDYLCFSVCLDKNKWECGEWWRSIIQDAAQTAQVSTVNTAAPACNKGAADIESEHGLPPDLWWMTWPCQASLRWTQTPLPGGRATCPMSSHQYQDRLQHAYGQATDFRPLAAALAALFRILDLGGWMSRYKFLRMPFGLKTASEEYQRRLYEIFQGLEGIEIIADDILILGKGDSYEEALKDHDRNLENLFKTARQANLKFNINKVKLRLKEVKYLGHIITPHGLKPDPEKVKALKEMPHPESITELKSFLGFATYLCKFMPNISMISEPLRKLTMKNSTWSWSKNHQAAFEQIKDLASKAPILRYFDADKSIAIQCDASKHGLGATLLQESQPIIFASRSLSKTEQNYAQIEKECLAIVFACERFHQYILGKCQVIVQTDHKPLLSIFKKSILKAPQRLQRMLLRLQRYNLELEHVQGSQMHLADIFSRACIKDVRNENLKYDVYPIDIIYKEIATVNVMETLSVCSDTVLRIREETSSDPILCEVKKLILNGWPPNKNQTSMLTREYWNFREELTVQDGIILKNDRIVIPNKLRAEMIMKTHQGHIGINSSMRRARDNIFWPGMNAKIGQEIENCSICLSNSQNQVREPMKSHKIPNYPWERISLDIFEIFKQNYLIIVDHYSDFFEVECLENTTSEYIIECCKRQFSRYGIPQIIVSDNGRQFTSTEFQKFSKEWQFQHSTSSPLHSQGNGKAEAAVKIAKNLLKKSKQENSDFWQNLLNWRNTPTIDIDSSPVQRIMSRRTRAILPIHPNLLKPSIPENIPDKISIKRQQAKYYYDRKSKNLPDLDIGQEVYVRTPNTTPSWSKANITNEHNTRSYDVNIHGRTYRRNRTWIKPQQASANQKSTNNCWVTFHQTDPTKM
ncbi:K02A2.6-like [Cordylochernes scorpioides]|uniref:RNA-directed DNA polymerase n=1 Tax=Cordylochernes scorpioides TaxID=51811 RepID=A0ABY6K4U2_9ARAC|nr:K02A2.6-like [Cordylochernes scorpioides]